jgi:hypothetical protein
VPFYQQMKPLLDAYAAQLTRVSRFEIAHQRRFSSVIRSRPVPDDCGQDKVLTRDAYR